MTDNDENIIKRLDNIEILLKDLLNKISCMRPLIGVDPSTIPRPKAPIPNEKKFRYGDIITNY